MLASSLFSAAFGGSEPTLRGHWQRADEVVDSVMQERIQRQGNYEAWIITMSLALARTIAAPPAA
jgi:hypothetical protein